MGPGRAGRVEGVYPFPLMKSLATANDRTEVRPSVKLLAPDDIGEVRPLVGSLGREQYRVERPSIESLDANYLGRVRPLVGSLA